MNAEQSTEVQVDVTNTSAVAGDTVAQVYIHQQAGSASRPVDNSKASVGLRCSLARLRH